MTTRHNDLAFRRLCDLVASDRLVCVTGAGISTGLQRDDGEALPNWWTLLDKLRGELRSQIDATDHGAEIDEWDGRAHAIRPVTSEPRSNSTVPPVLSASLAASRTRTTDRPLVPSATGASPVLMQWMKSRSSRSRGSSKGTNGDMMPPLR